ncbi:MAG TPA: tyrosine-type recombinase/integrase [Acidimicrobiales bacterium]|jgi:integrase|nr:tyrosine-type recombinase/integrase [Acidimicrobiales bacterium]
MTKTRRPKGAGSIRNRGSDRAPRWFAYHWVTIDGQRRQISGGPFPRKVDAEAWLRDELRLAREGRATVPRRITVAELLDDWLAVARRKLAPTTLAEYERITLARLRPHIGHHRLTELRPAHIAEMLEALRQPGANRRGTNRDHGLSETTLQHTLGVLRTALGWAVRQRLISHNPAEDVDRPQRENREMRTWSADELARFLDHAADDRLHPLFRLAAFTGMRRSELLGLRWPDVDLEAATISVRRTRTRVSYEMHEAARTKTKAGTRVVDIDLATVVVLRRWAKAQKAERLAWGPAYTDSGYVFTAEDGRPLHADSVANRFARLVRAADVPPIRFHDVRHTHASLLLAQGTPVLDVSRRIGHASAAMTLDVYGHVVPGQGQRAAAAFADLVGGGR